MESQTSPKAPFFSVVIPLYNKQNFVERAIRSVLMQTFEDFEIIVVDDGSTDDGPAIASRISDDRIRLIHQARSGVSLARNRGIELARASWIALLDADDEWASGFLATIHDLVQRFPEAGLYATAYNSVDHRGVHEVSCGTDFRDEARPELVRHFFRAACSIQPPIMSSNTCVPKSALEAVGGFPPGIQSGEDQAVWARLALTREVVISSRCEATYYEIGTENSTRYRYYGRTGHFDFLSLLQGKSESPHFDDLERWVEKKMFDMAMIALVHGNDRETVKDVLQRVSSRYWSARRRKIQALLLLPFRVRQFLFQLHLKTRTLRMSGGRIFC